MAEQTFIIEDTKDDWEYHNNNKDQDLKPQEIIVENALVAILGISIYDKPYWDLEGVIDNVETMKNLWHTYFNYDVNCLDTDKRTTKDDLVRFISTRIQRPFLSPEKDYDALILCLFGHGCNEGFITSDKQLYHMKQLQDHFGAKALPLKSTRPKLFIIDCCRGDKFPEDIKVPEQTQWKFRGLEATKTVHEDEGISLIYSNTANFKVRDGGPFANTMKNVMEQCNLCKHDLNNIVTMISERVAENTPLLCVEHVSRQKYSIKFKKRKEKGDFRKYTPMPSQDSYSRSERQSLLNEIPAATSSEKLTATCNYILWCLIIFCGIWCIIGIVVVVCFLIKRGIV